jgi:hypothetical protein
MPKKHHQGLTKVVPDPNISRLLKHSIHGIDTMISTRQYGTINTRNLP